MTTDALPVTLMAGMSLVALCAGFVDSIAGGGGLLTLPALLLAGLDPLTVVATNKLQTTFGSFSAVLSFWRAGLLQPRQLGALWSVASLGAVLGALTVSWIPRGAITTMLPFLLLTVAVYFGCIPTIRAENVDHKVSRRVFVATVIPACGFYDGVFGPGTGSFLMAGFVGLLGYGLVRAAAETKVANFASNLTSLFVLAFSGHVLWPLGLTMGAGQFLGARVGTWFTLRYGGRLVKPMLVTVCCILATRLLLAPEHPVGAWIKGTIATMAY